MKKIKHIGKDAEKITNGIIYIIVLVAIILLMVFVGSYILNEIIDPCLPMLEALAENALRMVKAVIKILCVIVFIVAIYKVFIESEKKY